MGRRSQTTHKRLLNLPTAAIKPDRVNGDASESEDLPPWQDGPEDTLKELRALFHKFDDDGLACESDTFDSDSDWELDENDVVEIKDDAALLTFVAVLQKAQQVAAAAQRRKEGPQRPRHYTGNSTQTQYRQARRRKELAADGQKFIRQWLSQKQETTPTETDKSSTEVDSLIEDIIVGTFRTINEPT
jgi:hypothetical protein